MAIVSVSREEGTWGGDVARDLASRLGYRLLDKKALLEEAEAYGGISEAAPELLERQPGLLERLDQERRRYSVLLRTVVYDVALRDNVVFLGRGAGMLLRDVDHALRALFIGSGADPRRSDHGARRRRAARSDDPGAGRRDRASRRPRPGELPSLPVPGRLARPGPPQHHDEHGDDRHPAAVDILIKMIESGAYDPTPASRAKLEQLARQSKDESDRLVSSRR